MWVCLALFLLFLAVRGQDNQLLQVQYGDTEINVLYNPGRGGNESFIITSYDEASNKLYVVKFNEDFTINNPTCKIQSLQSIIYGSYSCSNPLNPNAAVVADYCESADVEALRRKEIFKETFYLEATSSECFLKGGAGDKRLCMGPLFYSGQPNTPNQPLLDGAELLTTSIVFVTSLSGALNMAPTTVTLNIFRPQLIVESPCGGDVWNGTYDLSTNLETGYQYWKIWQKSNSQLYKFTLARDLANPLSYYLDLATLNSDGSLNVVYQSVDTLTLPTNVSMFDTNWFLNIDFGFTYNMTHVNATDFCNVTLGFTAASDPPQIQEVFQPTAANYSQNAFPEKYNRDSICGYVVGRLDENNLLYYDDCPEGAPCHGYAAYVYPEEPFPKIYVPPDPDAVFRLSCSEFYPRSETFLDLAGNTINREIYSTGLCFQPFINPELALNPTRNNEKFIQCQKLGGFTYGRSQLYCAKPLTLEYCAFGENYFDQWCMNKFDAFEQRRFAGTLEEHQSICDEFSPGMEPVDQVDQYLLDWLQNNFLYWNDNPERNALYRIPNFQSSSGSRCLCFDTETKSVDAFCPCFEAEKDGKPIFPICRRNIKEPGKQTKYFFTNVPVETAIVFQNGQVGPTSSGNRATCFCYPGFTGQHCMQRTCVIVDTILENPDPNNPIVQFGRKCYRNKQGFCFNANPDICECSTGFGPAAALDPALPWLYKHRERPCACPSSGALRFGPYEINGEIFPAEEVYHLPCSGRSKGACLVDNSTNAGVCDCRDRVVLNPSNPNELEPAYDGKNCGCDIPIEPYRGDTKNGPITQQLCNGRGTCCPFGQSLNNPFIGDLYLDTCYTETGAIIDGCVCTNAWTGTSCTCPQSYDWTFDKPIQDSGNDFVFLDIGERKFIQNINISNCDGLFNRVQVANALDDTVDCTFSNQTKLYHCQTPIAHQFIYIFPSSSVTELTDLETCLVKSYEGTYFEACGPPANVNPFSGRFYELPAYRSTELNIYEQLLNQSNYGCTNGECMCDTDKGGKECRVGVSSLRSGAKYYCGQETLLPTRLNPVQGRGQVTDDGCVCNPITNWDPTGLTGIVAEAFYGEACECELVYNPDRDRVLPCAGHGTCQVVDIPLGRCEVDLDNYVADALYNPFVTVIDIAELETEHVVTSTGYFSYLEYVTNAPTTSPTPFPAAIPTAAPTPPTDAPTSSPTNAPITAQAIYLFPRGNSGEDGNFGSTYQAAAQTCQSSVNLPEECSSQVFPFANFSDVTFDELPNFYSFDPSISVYSGSGVQVSASYGSMFVNGLNISFSSSGVIPGSTPGVHDRWWSGAGESNCNNWTSTSGLGTYGSSFDTDLTWVDDGTVGCSFSIFMVCGCTSTIVPSQTTNEWIISGQNYTADGSIGLPLTWEEMLTNCAAVEPDACTSGNLPLISFNSTYNIQNFFVDGLDAPVYGDTGLQIAATALDFVSNITSDPTLADISLTIALNTGVESYLSSLGELIIVTGGTVGEDSGTDYTCSQWTSVDSSEFLIYGRSIFTDKDWVAETALTCDYLGPSPPPTPAPVDYTHLCACSSLSTAFPTAFPTDAPTNSPTTFPTRAPTSSPTLSPTQFPTPPPEPVRIMYKYDAPGTIIFNEITRPVSYFDYGVGMEVNITNTETMTPVWWSNLIYRQYNITSMGTDTLTLTRCNPANQAIPPGDTSNDEFCPFLDMCESGDSCTDDLEPVMGVWPYLRGCICSYDITERGDVPSIPAGGFFSELPYLHEIETTSTRDDITLIYGQIECNSFIDRSINCVFFMRGLPIQCANEPIGCFDGTLGFAFGGFDQQHPTVKYNIPQDEWNIRHYIGIASILNFRHYENYVNPLNADLLNAYLDTWLPANFSDDIVTLTVSPSQYAYQTDLIQARNAWKVYEHYPIGLLNSNQLACQNGNTSLCANQGWTNVTNEIFARPGIVYFIPIENALSLEITPNHAPDYAAIEVRNDQDQICGQAIMEGNFEAAESYTFTCIAKSNTNSTGFYVRYVGAQSIYDAPGQSLTNFEAVPDPLLAELTTLNTNADWGISTLTTILLNKLTYAFNVFGADVIDIQGLNPEGTFPTKTNSINRTLLESTTIYSANVSLNTVEGLATLNTWGNLTNFIIENNVYPFNTPLAAKNYNSRPINYDTDQDYLYNVWTTWLAPRFAGSNTQCQTFGLGDVVYPEDSFNRPWLQGDLTRENVIGDEGGCLCDHQFGLGFYDLALACRVCQEGYGPETIDAWDTSIQYSGLITETMSESLASINDPNYSQFKNELSCRFPYGRDPVTAAFQDINVCAGHGILSNVSSTSGSFSQRTWQGSFGQDLAPKCPVIYVDTTRVFTLFPNITDIGALIYTETNTNETLNIINGALYRNSTLCALRECTQSWPAPDLCQYECGPDTLSTFCVNDNLWDEEGRAYTHLDASGNRVIPFPSEGNRFTYFYKRQ